VNLRPTLIPLVFVALVGFAAAASLSVPAAEWQVRQSADMSTPRAAHQATLLPAHQVLLTGGCRGPGCSAVERSAEIFNTDTGRFVATRAMNEQRVSHIAAALPEGRVLVAGGWTGTTTSSSAEVFDPVSGGFVAVGNMANARMDATATALQDGSVLVIGGASATNQPLAQAELFERVQARFSPAGTMEQARVHHAAVRLPDGRVLVMGGLRARNLATRSAEIYDPAKNRFEATGSMRQARCKHAALLLKDGRVLVIAGSTNCEEDRRIAQTEIYDPKTATFSPGPTLLNPRYKITGAAAVLPSGEVLVAGDAQDVEVWTPGQPGFYKVQGGIGVGLAFSVATALPGGDVLVTGGYDGSIRATAQTWRARREPTRPSPR